MPLELTAKKKKKSLFSSVISAHSIQQWTSSQMDCDVWQKVYFMWQPAITSSVVTLRSSKALPTAKFTSPKMSRSLSAGLLLVWSTIGFWIPVKPLHLRSRLSKSMGCTKNRNAYSQHWSTERAQFFSLTRSNRTSHNQCFKMCTDWATNFCLTTIFIWPFTNRLPLFQASRQLFARKMLPQPRMLSTSLSNPKARIFTL